LSDESQVYESQVRGFEVALEQNGVPIATASGRVRKQCVHGEIQRRLRLELAGQLPIAATQVDMFAWEFDALRLDDEKFEEVVIDGTNMTILADLPIVREKGDPCVHFFAIGSH
jgi:hypothetical protein